MLQPGTAALHTENFFVSFCIQNRVTTTKFMLLHGVVESDGNRHLSPSLLVHSYSICVQWSFFVAGCECLAQTGK